MLWCWGEASNNAGLFEERCDRVDRMRTVYTNCSMIAMFLYYLLLIDLVVFSNRVSAFVLVCGRMLGEVSLFLLALGVAILITASSSSVYMGSKPGSTEDLKQLHFGMLSLLEMSLGMYGKIS